MPDAVNSEDDTVSCVMLTDLLPVLVSVAVCVAMLPTLTFGKVKLAGVICTSSSGVRFALDVLAKPAQPLNIPVPVITTASNEPSPTLRVRHVPGKFLEIPLTASPRTISSPASVLLLSEGRVRFESVYKILARRPNKGQVFSCPAEQALGAVPFPALEYSCTKGRATVLAGRREF
jgi:hypothetical protein